MSVLDTIMLIICLLLGTAAGYILYQERKDRK